MQPVMWNLDKSFQQFYFAFVFLRRGADPLRRQTLGSQMAGVRASGGGEDSDRGVCQKRRLISVEKENY